jgi:hypothetical protein
VVLLFYVKRSVRGGFKHRVSIAYQKFKLTAYHEIRLSRSSNVTISNFFDFFENFFQKVFSFWRFYF